MSEESETDHASDSDGSILQTQTGHAISTRRKAENVSQLIHEAKLEIYK